MGIGVRRIGSHAILIMASFVTSSCTLALESEETEEVGVDSESLTLQDHINVCNADPRVTLGLVPLATCVGADLFFREPFGGNGRTCATCHPTANNFTIDPTSIAALPAGDPLFVAEQVPALAGLEKPTLMRNFGLILENVDDTSNPTVRFVMRSVPHCFSMGTSITAQAVPNDGTTRPPNERTGWSGDGAPNQGELRDFQTGAIIQHYTKSLNRIAGTDFVLATSDELTFIRAFLGTIGRTNELVLTSLVLSDPGAEAGRVTFLSAAARCNGCHNNAGANVAAAFNRNFNTGVERLRITDLNTQNIPFDGGFGGPGVPSFNFDANGDSINDSFGNGTFNTPPLIEAADTGPFFHTNAFQTIEAAIGFYNTTAFNTSPSGTPNIALTPTQVTNVGRFLRVLNTAFNSQLALRRISAAISINQAHENNFKEIQKQLAALAREEVIDALADLTAVNMHSGVQTQLSNARDALQVASTLDNAQLRKQAAQNAFQFVTNANAGLTSTPGALTFSMGAGSLMF